MTYALDTAYKMTGDVNIIKDFLNALQYVQNPQDAICMTSEPPPEPVVTVEIDGECKRVLIDGLPVTGWICPPDPEQPPPPEPPVGTLGYTVAELECMIMGCINIAGLLKFENGKFYAKDDCCNWVEIPGQASPVVTTNTAAAVAAGMSYQQWIDSGKPSLPTLPGAEHTDPGYTTAASLQCAKASALVNTLKQFLTEVKETLSDLVSDNLGFADIVELLAAGFMIGNLPGVFAVASLIFGAHETAESLISQIDDNLTDDDMWLDVICETTERMNNSQVIGTDDVDETITNWQERDLSGELLKQIIYAYPVSTWQKVTTSALPDTDCGCSQYLPGGYVAPLPSDTFQFTVDRIYKATNSIGGVVNPAAGEAFSGINTPAGTDGTLVSGYPQTSLTANDSGLWHHGFGLLLKMSEEATIAGIHLQITLPLGQPPSTGGAGIAVYTFNNLTGLWEAMGGVGDGSIPLDLLYELTGASMQHVTYIALAFTIANPNTETARNARAVSITLDGTYSADSFTALELGEIHTP